jgi:CBS domain-containing protein
MEIMDRNPVSIRETSTVLQALKILDQSLLSSVPVIDADGRVIGIASEYDLIKLVSSKRDRKPVFDSQVPYSPPISVKEMASLEEIEKLVLKKKLRRVPVVDDRGRLKGMVSRRSLVQYYIMEASKELE